MDGWMDVWHCRDDGALRPSAFFSWRMRWQLLPANHRYIHPPELKCHLASFLIFILLAFLFHFISFFLERNLKKQQKGPKKKKKKKKENQRKKKIRSSKKPCKKRKRKKRKKSKRPDEDSPFFFFFFFLSLSLCLLLFRPTSVVSLFVNSPFTLFRWNCCPVDCPPGPPKFVNSRPPSLRLFPPFLPINSPAAVHPAGHPRKRRALPGQERYG